MQSNVALENDVCPHLLACAPPPCLCPHLLALWDSPSLAHASGWDGCFRLESARDPAWNEFPTVGELLR
jgi:hypothetical protein